MKLAWNWKFVDSNSTTGRYFTNCWQQIEEWQQMTASLFPLNCGTVPWRVLPSISNYWEDLLPAPIGVFYCRTTTFPSSVSCWAMLEMWMPEGWLPGSVEKLMQKVLPLDFSYFVGLSWTRSHSSLQKKPMTWSNHGRARGPLLCL
jgi:hypothetical protein